MICISNYSKKLLDSDFTSAQERFKSSQHKLKISCLVLDFNSGIKIVVLNNGVVGTIVFLFSLQIEIAEGTSSMILAPRMQAILVINMATP